MMMMNNMNMMMNNMNPMNNNMNNMNVMNNMNLMNGMNNLNNMNGMKNMNNMNNNQFMGIMFNIMQNNLMHMNFKTNPNMMNIMNNNNNFQNNMPQLPNPTQSKMSNSAKKLNKIIRIESVIRINKSKYINDEQYDVITQICSDALNEEKINNNEIAIYCTEKIKKKIKGQWFVLIQNVDDNNFDFGFSKIKFENILIFKYREKIIYIKYFIIYINI